MKKSFNKALSILLVFTFIVGFYAVPPQLAQAAATNLLDSITLVSGSNGNVKVSSENSTKKANFANSYNGVDFWQNGGSSASVYPTEQDGKGSLWIAVDLGAAKPVEEVSFDIPISFTNVKDRMSGYQVYYSSNDNTWTSLPAVYNSKLRAYDLSQTAWSLAKQVSVPDSVYGSDPNWGSDFVTPSKSDWTATRSGAFDSVTARYVLIHYDINVNPTSKGLIGMSNLKILSGSPSVPGNPSISPSSGSYPRGSGSSLSAALSLNGKAITSVAKTNSVSNAVYMNANQDYTLGAVTAGAQTVTFTEAFLDSLPEGDTTVTFSFSGGTIQTYKITISLPSFSDVYLNNPGSGHAIIEPDYTGMSRTIGRPAVIDANAATGKFPVFRVSKALVGTSVAGSLIGPNGEVVYTLNATQVDPEGKAVLTIPDNVALTKGTYRAAFKLTNNGKSLYDTYYFTAIDNFSNYRSIPNTKHSNNANVANVHPDSWENGAYPAIQLDASGKLNYIPDYKGNQIMDYSTAGYKGGGVAIPNVPVRAKVSPLADNSQDAWQVIQDAINYVSRYPVQADGFRGAVYLEPGVFRISKPLQVVKSGVVIRGAGAGTATPVVGEGTQANPYDLQIASEDEEQGVTKLISTWTITTAAYTPANNHSTTTGSPFSKGSNSTLIHFKGEGPTQTSTATSITDQYVGAGQYTVHVANVSGFAVGDLVSVQKAINPDWVKALYMDKVDGESNWLPNGKLESGFAGVPFTSERTIKSIDAAANTLTFAEPLSDNLDMRWGVANIVKLTEGGRITNVGIENIQAISHFYNLNKPSLERFGKHYKSYNDENHAMVFVSMDNVRDGWLRNFTTYHIDSGFVTTGKSRNITVQDGQILDPVSLMNAGERRYSVYYKDSEFMLTHRVNARYNRHAFIVDSYTSGPNVFYNSQSEYVSNASEPHFRWSSGGLFDNVLARIHLQNRWSYGTSHGWSGVNYLLYNVTGPFSASMPQLSPTYVIGHAFDAASNRLGDIAPGDPAIGRQKLDHDVSANMTKEGFNGGKVPNFEAYEYSVNQLVTPAANQMPDSIYIQQLVDRLGPQAADNIASTTVPPMIDKATSERPKLTSLKVNGEAVSGFSPGVNSYMVTPSLDYDYSKQIAIDAQAAAGIQIEIAYPDKLSGGEAVITLTDGNGVRNFYSIHFNVLQKSPIITSSGQQVDSSNSNYAVNVLNPADYAGTSSIRWAADNNQWIAMYLGQTAKSLEGVQIGFVQHGSNPRQYGLRIEYSMNGQNWSVVPLGTVSSTTLASPTPWTADADAYISSLVLNGGNASTPENVLQTFTFDSPVQARLIRVSGNGNMTGSSKSPWNNYWRLRPVFPQGAAPYTPPTGVSITGPAVLHPAGTAKLTAHLTPGTTTVTDVIWISSNPAVATVDATGLVTGVAEGTVTITATTADGVFISPGTLQQAVAVYNVSVTPNPTDPNPTESDSTESDPAESAPVVTAPVVSAPVVGNAITISAGQSGEVGLGEQIVVTIPAKASNQDLKISIEKVADTQGLTAGQEKDLISEVFEILKNVSDNFINPVTLTLSFNPNKLKAGQTVSVFYFDEVNKIWVKVLGGEISGNKISVEVDHFTKFAVFAVAETDQQPEQTITPRDITGHWAENKIKQAVTKGIISGYPDGTFKPNHSVTRAEFALMVMNSIKPQGEGAALAFTDQAEIGSWAQKAVAQALQLGIVQGYEDGSFRPNAVITRAEMAVMLAQATGLSVETAAVTGFADDSEVPAWAKGAVTVLKRQKLVEGRENNEFSPLAPITRAEAVTVILNMLNLESK